MPDILIHMEMPKSCADCHDADLPTAIAWLEAKCPCVYGMNEPGVYDLRHKRHPDCPLVELPEHGDLIDVSKISIREYEQAAHDALHNGKGSILYDCGVLAGARAITLLVRRAPVVIPAEKGETQ